MLVWMLVSFAPKSTIYRNRAHTPQNERGAFDFKGSARRMPPPIPMPPRSFFESLAGSPLDIQRQVVFEYARMQNDACTSFRFICPWLAASSLSVL